MEITALDNSAYNKLILGAFPFFDTIIFFCLHFSRGGWVAVNGNIIRRLWVASSSGSARSGTYLNCWTHLLACSFSVIISSPCISLVGARITLISHLLRDLVYCTELSFSCSVSASPANPFTQRVPCLFGHSSCLLCPWYCTQSGVPLHLSACLWLLSSHRLYCMPQVLSALSFFFLKFTTLADVSLYVFNMLSHVASTKTPSSASSFLSTLIAISMLYGKLSLSLRCTELVDVEHLFSSLFVGKCYSLF